MRSSALTKAAFCIGLSQVCAKVPLVTYFTICMLESVFFFKTPYDVAQITDESCPLQSSCSHAHWYDLFLVAQQSLDTRSLYPYLFVALTLSIMSPVGRSDIQKLPKFVL